MTRAISRRVSTKQSVQLFFIALLFYAILLCTKVCRHHGQADLSEHWRLTEEVAVLGHAPAGGDGHLVDISIVGAVLQWQADRAQMRIAAQLHRTLQFVEGHIIGDHRLEIFRFVVAILRVTYKLNQAHGFFVRLGHFQFNVVCSCVCFEKGVLFWSKDFKKSGLTEKSCRRVGVFNAPNTVTG